MLREKGVQQWIFDEISLVNKLKFDNEDKMNVMNYSHMLASAMQYYSLEDVLVQPYLFEKYDCELI